MNLEEPYLKEESDTILACAFAVHNDLGHGLAEKPYENALAVEFRHREIPFEQQSKHEIRYRGELVGKFIPDLIVFGKIIIDTKTIEQISDIELGQMLNYLRVCKLHLGYVINFKHPKVEWKRVVLDL